MMKSLGSLDGKGTPPMSSATGEPSRLPPFVIAIKSLHEAGACLTLTLTNPYLP